MMPSLLRSLVPRRSVALQANDAPLPFDEWARMFNFGGFPFLFANQGYQAREEDISTTFAGLTDAWRANGIVYACELARVSLFSEARFQFRQRRSGRPGDLFGTPALRILETPAPSRTTGDLLTRAMLHADFGGTAFMIRRGARIRQPRPDWMSVMLGSYDDPDITGDDLDAEVIGFLYHPGGPYSGQRPVALLPEQVATFAPVPDPIAHVRGIPWLATVVPEVIADRAATTHKMKFFENGATPQMIVSLDKGIVDPVKYQQWVDVMEQDHKGATNAYRTLYIGAGSTATVVGKDLQQLDFKATQGAGETRIAAASGVGAIIAQLSEGMQGSSLNAGNYATALRRVADLTMRPAWRNIAGSLQTIIDVPADAELWYDDRDIPALKDDVKDAAEVISLKAAAMRTLWDGGAETQSVIDAIEAGDLKRIKHTGNLSVQLQPPGTTSPPRPALAAGSDSLPLLASGEMYEARCTGTKKDGSACNALLGKRPTPDPLGFETKCHQCGSLVAA